MIFGFKPFDLPFDISFFAMTYIKRLKYVQENWTAYAVYSESHPGQDGKSRGR